MMTEQQKLQEIAKHAESKKIYFYDKPFGEFVKLPEVSNVGAYTPTDNRSESYFLFDYYGVETRCWVPQNRKDEFIGHENEFMVGYKKDWLNPRTGKLHSGWEIFKKGEQA